jgi:hypothetical protein
MKKNEPRSLQDILASGSESIFTRIARQQTDNDTLLGRIRALLPSHFAQHLTAVTYREKVLVMVADSPAWANRIRYENEHIRGQLIHQGVFSDQDESAENGIQKIVVRTAAAEIK